MGMRDLNESDEALAKRAARGDRAAFALLLERVYNRIFAMSFRLTGSRAEAEDLTQDVCAALPAKLAGFRGEARVTTWLHRVVLNAGRDRFRRRASFDRAATGWGDWEIARRASDAEAQERADWLMQAMALLVPPELRDTVLLILDGLSHAEAAEVLGVSEGTVSWRISEAKKKLKALREATA
jgi:RNA polymerase sigma-70 factor (ECF subfamily)